MKRNAFINFDPTRFNLTCKRVLIVSRGVVMQDAVAPAIIAPVACTATIVPWLGPSFSRLVVFPNILSKKTI